MVTADRLMVQLDKMDAVNENYAKAYADAAYLERFSKVLVARLVKESNGKTVSEREADAYGSVEYETHINGLREAERLERSLRWKKESLMARIDIWRSVESSRRALHDKI